jgi:hypothetical protein
VACLTEFEYAVYADGELPIQESRRMADHLETCASCRKLVAGLRAESRTLVECFQSTDFIEFELEDEALSASQAHNLSALKLTAFVLAMSVLLRPVMAVLEEFGFRQTVNGLSMALIYLVPMGIRIAGSLFNHAGWIALGAILLLALIVFSRRSAVTSSILSLLALLTVFSSSSYGLDIRTNDRPVTVPPGETVDDTLIVGGDSATIEGVVTGDLVAMVSHLTIRGTVKGNVVTCARRVDVEGTVEGSLFGIARSIETRGRVARNIYALAAESSITPEAKVGENAVLFGPQSGIGGSVGRDAYTWGRSLDVQPTANIRGTLSARVTRAGNVRVAPGSTIGGKTDIRTTESRPNRYATLSFYVWQTIWLAAALVTGLALFWLFPSLSRITLATTQDLLVSAGVGFLTLVGLPAAALLATITLIGLPLGCIGFACWILGLYAAKIVVAGFLGRSFVRDSSGSQPPTALLLLAGLLPLFIAINLPYIGVLVNFLVTLLGLGTIAIAAYRLPRWRSAMV